MDDIFDFLPPSSDDFDPPVPDFNDDEVTIARVLVPRTGLIVEIKSSGDPTLSGIDFITESDLDYIKDNLREILNVDPVEDDEEITFGRALNQDIHALPPSIDGTIRKRGSLRSIRNWLQNIVGAESFMVVYFDEENGEYVVVQIEDSP